MHGKNVVHMTSGTDKLRFFYDAQNRPAVVVYNGTAYAYVKSLQGDILAILDENGNTVVSYGYDAWGAPLWCIGELAETLGKVQPFRYRGYVYDEETELYYLRSRYYAALRSRMLNHDSRLFKNETFEFNGYVYCMNNPIAYHDPSGTCVSCETVDEVGYRKTTTDDDFNSTVTQGMRNLLYNADDYYYISASKNNKGGIDCIWAVNKALNKKTWKMVDAAWQSYVRSNTTRGRILDLNDLQPGDIIFSIDHRDPNYGKDVKDIARIDPVKKGHIGIVVSFDFGDGNGEVLAVFQSCSEKLYPDKWTALFYDDTGPNITALEDNDGNSNWAFYVRPKK